MAAMNRGLFSGCTIIPGIPDINKMIDQKTPISFNIHIPSNLKPIGNDCLKIQISETLRISKYNYRGCNYIVLITSPKFMPIQIHSRLLNSTENTSGNIIPFNDTNYTYGEYGKITCETFYQRIELTLSQESKDWTKFNELCGSSGIDMIMTCIPINTYSSYEMTNII